MSVAVRRLRTLGAPLLAVLFVSSLLIGPPAQAQKIRANFFGMHDNDWVTPPTVAVGSANLTTSGTYWPSIEKSKGTYDWTRLEMQVTAAEAISAQPMIVLGQTPKFHSSKPGSVDYADYMPSVKAWKRYVSKVADRFGARLDYQIWPEPNIIQNWKGSPRQMAKLTVVAAKAIRKHAGKNARVVSPAVALRLPAQQKWTVSYFKQRFGGVPVAHYVDAVAIDPFPLQDGTPEDSLAIMRSIRKQLGRIGVHRPFWSNEINYGVAGAGAPTSTTYPVAKQQSYVVRTYVLSAAARMQRTYWLGWFSTTTMAVRMVDSMGVPQPPSKSYEVVRSWLNNTNFQGCDRHKNGLWVCTTRQGKQEVRRIYWKTGGTTTIKTPRSTLRVENQGGNVNSTHGARKVQVDFRPIMVASKK